ncbi:MAG: ATP-binding protein [Desulfuromonadales bacterium]|nr:ATP-binding protein [Desulfuromonadales bacterium]
MPVTIQRSILEEIRKDLHREEISLLIGPRQAGKTTIMKILQRELDAAGEKTLFLSLDYDSDRNYFASQQTLLKKIELEFGDAPCFVFIDEIQRREDAGIFLKGLQDMGRPCKYIVSGSGSVDLKAKVKESMLGRKRIYEIYPLSLREFVDFRTGYRYADRLSDFFELEKERSAELLLEYLNYGGYPRVVLETVAREKLRVMDEIYQGYITKDIAYLLKVEKIEAYGQLMKTLSDQTGKIINYSELATTLGISLPTVKNYCWYAEETYILKRITPFFRNIRSEISKAPSVYFSDPGFRNYALGVLGHLQRPDDLGFAFQNLVYLVLREKLRWSGAQIHFWRTKGKTEIDFVVDTGRSTIPIEVKYRELTKPSPPRALDGFAAKYRPARCLVVNRSLRATVRMGDTDVRFTTIWELLLDDSLLKEEG